MGVKVYIVNVKQVTAVDMCYILTVKPYHKGENLLDIAYRDKHKNVVALWPEDIENMHLISYYEEKEFVFDYFTDYCESNGLILVETDFMEES